LIDFLVSLDASGAFKGGAATWPNGTVVEYGAPSDYGNVMYPTRITDANGNYITIAYRGNTGPDIENIVDTLGRVINFHYDSSNRLTAVTAPKVGGGTRTAVRLHYGRLNLWYNFDPQKLWPIVNPSDWKIDAIYLPDTSTGYWFGDADSYSSYGMIAKVKQQRGMNLQASSLTYQGTITPGITTRERDYNYPLTGDAVLADAPTYTRMTDSWAGMDSSLPAITHYSAQMDANPRRIDIVYPDLTRVTQLLNNNPGQFDDGLLVQQNTSDADGNLLLQSTTSWEPGDYDSPRVHTVSVTDELKQTTTTVYFYNSSPNGLTDALQLDYDGHTVLRQTHTDYWLGPEYEKRHIFNLPGRVQVYNCPMVHGHRVCNDVASRTDYNYDQWLPSNTPGVVSHWDAYNPYAPATWVPPDDHLECDDSGALSATTVRDGGSHCHKVHDPGYWLTDYHKEFDYRGNITQIIRYPDAANSNRQIIETRTYDIDGNLVTTRPACCEETDFGYTVETKFAYPTTISRGSPESSDVRVNTYVSYDPYTGLQVSTTDANGRKTSFSYDPALRPKQVTLPTSATITYDYDDAAMTTSQTSRYANDKLAAQSRSHMNGLGLARQTETLAPDNTWNAVGTKYDIRGRVWQQSQPFQLGSGQQPAWNEISYDALGRITGLKGADHSQTLTYYNEATRPSSASADPGQTVRLVDPVQRERWSRTDALGNLAEVVEPNAYGDGSLGKPGSTATSYTYNALGLLTGVVQGPSKQGRYFRYDSMGRLTAQHLPEKSATLDDAGDYNLGELSLWSDVFAYDDRSNLTSHTDARGIKTIYDYGSDPFDRLLHLTYDMTGFGDTGYPVLPAPDVSYTYRTTGDLTQISQITSMPVPQRGELGTTESYHYDARGLLSSKQLTYGGQSPLTLDYKFDDFGRLLEETYPAEYGVTAAARKKINYSYGIGGSLADLQINGIDYASQPTYNPAGQLASLMVGATEPGQALETYGYDPNTSLMSRQRVLIGDSVPLDLGYTYFLSHQLAQLTDNRDGRRSQGYSYDGLSRLHTATGATWMETYTFDPYGNRTGVSASGQTSDGTPIPLDGLPMLSYDAETNHVNTQGFWYDATGNQTRAQRADGSWFRYQYDAAGRLAQVTDDKGDGLEAYFYGADRRRLVKLNGPYWSTRTYYVWDGNHAVAEYTQSRPPPALPEQPSSAQLVWSKSTVYLGDRVLASFLPGKTSEFVQYHHPDRLGTRFITNNGDGPAIEQVTLPFGTLIPGQSSDPINPIFTSYDRSAMTGLDYAINRQYNPQQRFTQVDPVQLAAGTSTSPQNLNLYGYAGNDPVNRIDPLGLQVDYKGYLTITAAIAAYYGRLDLATAAVVTYGGIELWQGAALGSLAAGAATGAGAVSETITALSANPVALPAEVVAGSVAGQAVVLSEYASPELLNAVAAVLAGPGTRYKETPNPDGSVAVDATTTTAWADGTNTSETISIEVSPPTITAGTQGTEVTDSWSLDLSGGSLGGECAPAKPCPK